MRRSAWVVVIAVLAAVGPRAWAVSAGEIPPPEPAKIFDTSQRHIYSVRWMGIPIGIGTLEVVGTAELNGRRVYQIKAIGRSNRFFSRFTLIRDEVQTYLDAERLVPLRFDISQREGKYRAEERVDFDHAAKRARYESFINGSVKTFEIPSGVYDALSGFFHFRLQPLTLGQAVTFPVCADEKHWDLSIQVVEQAPLEMLRQGVHDAILVEPDAIARNTIFRKRIKRAQIWVTADGRRLPLLAKLWLTGFGFVSASYERSEPR